MNGPYQDDFLTRSFSIVTLHAVCNVTKSALQLGCHENFTMLFKAVFYLILQIRAMVISGDGFKMSDTN